MPAKVAHVRMRIRDPLILLLHSLLLSNVWDAPGRSRRPRSLVSQFAAEIRHHRRSSLKQAFASSPLRVGWNASPCAMVVSLRSQQLGWVPEEGALAPFECCDRLSNFGDRLLG